MKIINKKYNIDSNLNKKIVHISDLHYLNKNDIQRLNCLLDNIKNINPDFICITGDIIDKSKVCDEEIFFDWLKRLSKITKVIISIGNHEFYIDKHNKVFGLNKEILNKISIINNVYLLDNRNIIIDNINFIGITIPINYYNNEKKYLNSFKNDLNNLKTIQDKYNILLCHSPISICNKDILKSSNIDLVLCGHMHGGIVPRFLRPLFRKRGIISPNKKLFPSNVYGKLKIENTTIIITSGIKVIPYKNINKFFKSEIVIIRLEHK